MLTHTVPAWSLCAVVSARGTSRENTAAARPYTDESFSKTNHWELSTSQLSSPFLDGWGYGEGTLFLTLTEHDLSYGTLNANNCMAVVPDGYGLSYSIGDHYIRWTITSLKRNTAELKHYLAEAATETRAMMERAAKEAKKAEGEKSKL